MKHNSDIECSVCGSSSNAQEKFKHLQHYAQWDLYECHKCTFQFWWPMEQANQKWWENSYVTYKSLEKTNLEPRHKNLLKNIPLKNGRILDIGCGEGVFLYEMSKRGFDVYGIDLNRWAIAKARKRFRLKNLHSISIYDFSEKEPNKFELITFFEVLEHIGDPKKFIIIIKKLLNNGGFIAFSVPDVKMYGHFEENSNVPPHHFSRWTSDTLKIFLIENGFDIVISKKINRLDSVCFLNNILMRLLRRHSSVDKFNKNILALWRYTSFPFREFLYILGFRSTFFVIAQLKSNL